LFSISRYIHSEGQFGPSGPGGSVNTKQAMGLKVIVTSRPENQIKVAFERMPRSANPLHGLSTAKTALLRLRGGKTKRTPLVRMLQ
jgi:hypothetical protein